MDSASESGAAAAFSTAAYTSSWYAGNSGTRRGLGGLLGQRLLRAAQARDERLGGLETLGHDRLGGRLGATVDQADDVLGGLGLDHHDRDVTGLDHAARDDHVEDGALELLDGRERDPLALLSPPR